MWSGILYTQYSTIYTLKFLALAALLPPLCTHTHITTISYLTVSMSLSADVSANILQKLKNKTKNTNRFRTEKKELSAAKYSAVICDELLAHLKVYFRKLTFASLAGLLNQYHKSLPKKIFCGHGWCAL